jgi:Branched-chain amino acid ABC-type transport system, permease components
VRRLWPDDRLARWGPGARGVPVVTVAVGAFVAWWLAGLVLPKGAPLGVVLTGVVLGNATGLLAIGLVLIYRTSRIVNFAYGSIGGVAGLVAVNLFLQKDWNYFVAMAAGVSCGMAVGGSSSSPSSAASPAPPASS